LELINDVLDLSKIEAGAMHIHHTPVDIRRLLNDIQIMFAARVQEEKLTMNIRCADDVPAIMFLDDLRLQQVLLNLVGNAIKFTEFGSVAIAVHLEKPLEKAAEEESVIEQFCTLLVDVTDSGIGIPDDQQELIFEAFRQRDGQSTRQYGGTGLGLTISRRLVEMMRGTLSVQSQLGIGSMFTLRLPEVRWVHTEENTEGWSKGASDASGASDIPEKGEQRAANASDQDSQSSSDGVAARDERDERSGSTAAFSVTSNAEIMERLRREIVEFEDWQLREIAGMLGGEAMERWQEISSGAIQTQRIIRFGEYIQALGERYRVQTLMNYGATVATQVQNFDVRNVYRLLRQFPDIVNGISSAIQARIFEHSER
jgi:Histidine kinase-, DNA gyrase B-, and HSP90-like ATPase